MFIQVIEGKTSDPEGLHQRLDVWTRDLMPGAIGYLGSTGGCTSSGDCILIARFESRDSAQRNSDRPEQTAWWRETERFFDGPVTFHDTEDVEIMDHGRLDDAHFVQVMEGHVTDRARATALEHEADAMLRDIRPDLIGSVTVYYGDNEFAEIAYFTSESEARAGESKPMSDDAAKKFDEWERVMKVERYLDISDPWLVAGSATT
jgi:hypothetical protein